MVLIDSRTISKSINSDDQTDDVYDAITDLYTANHKPKHNRHIHKHRRLDKHEVTKPINSKIHAKLTKHGKPKLYGKVAKVEPIELDMNYPMLTTIKVPLKVVEHQKHKLPKPRVGSYWRKFRNKLRKNKQNDKPRKRRIYNNEYIKQNHYNYRKRRQNIDEYVLERPKHSVNTAASRTTITGLKKWLFDEKLANKASTKMKTELRTRHECAHERNTTPTYVNLEAELAAMTTEILHLKELYSVDKYLTTTIKPQFFEYTEPKTSTVYQTEFPGTAQIEELLNDIKAKAIQMIAEQSPSISDMISNTVTEATFEADPILAHTEFGVPGYAFSTFVSINAIDEGFNKRYADTSKSNEYETKNPSLINYTEPHDVKRRAIKEDAITIAQSVEDMLQKELKKALTKARAKISCEIQKGMQKIKASRQKGGLYQTTPMNPERLKPISGTKKIYESTSSKNNLNNKHKKQKVDRTRAPDVSTHISTLDDYIMLTLCEKMLVKTRDDNMIKIVTGNDPPLRIRKRDQDLLSKRNLETLTDLKLKEDIQKIYDDGVNMPEYDYNTPEDSTERAETKTKSTDDQFYDEPRTEAGREETSYDALSNKIAYNDFVNGYKHYLKFQKDQANSNFSNMVKYQAHKHHNVDDIGKFILNKIPPLPNRINKRFFDDTELEDQEASTKNVDSWFKKHFYFFIDNGPPKKYHTSQTVSLKHPIKAPKDNLYAENKNEAGEDGVFSKIVPNEMDETTQLESNSEMNLEELSRNLEGNKRQGSHILPLLSLTTNQPVIADVSANHKRFAPRKLIGKIFGEKKRQTPKHDINDNNPIEQLNRTGRLKRGTNDSSKEVNNDKHKNKAFKIGDARARILGENSKKKHGYVNINVVPQPTAIVKLRNSSTKKSKIKNFLKKFRFHNKATTPKKVKRHLIRKRRFSPLKKFRGLFSMRTDNKPIDPGLNMDDYEITSSQVDGFKPIQYDRPMTIEEMKQQIPNITDVLDDILLKPARTSARSGSVSSDFKWAEDYGFLNNQLANFEVGYNESTKTASNLVPGVKYTAPPTKKRTTKKHTAKTTPITTSFRINLHIKKVKPTISRLLTTKQEARQALMTLQDMGNEIENIQSKLFYYHKQRPTFRDVLTAGHAYKKSTSAPNNRAFSSKSTVNPIRHGVHKMGTSNPNIILKQSTSSQSRHATNFASKYPTKIAGLTAKPLDENFTILKGKLTRIAKFPLSHHKNADLVQLFNEYSDEYVDVDQPVMDYKRHNINTKKNGASAPKATCQPLHSATVTKLDTPLKQNDIRRKYKINSDYFNDLLLWHNDLLDADRVTNNPFWKRMIDAMDENTYTTPNLINLVRELKEINKYLNIAGGGKTAANNYRIRNANDTPNIGIIKSLAINDKALAESDDVIIKGEANYLRFNKPVTENNVKITGFDDFLGFKEYPKNGVNVIDYRRNTAQTEEPNILVDPTLMAYDDDMDYINGMGPKKLSRNSLKAATDLIKSKPNPSVIARTNQQPKQYYTTPLPMKSNEFDKFLKQNALDVESVTSPLSILPTYVDTWSHKSPTPEITSGPKTQGVTVKDAKKIENVTPELLLNDPVTKDKVTTTRDVAFDAKNKPLFDFDDNFDNTRIKRFVDIDAGFNIMPYTMDTIRRKKYYDKLKKKMNLFENKYNQKVSDSTKFDAFDDLARTEKEVEITIINFDDINKMPFDSSGLDYNWDQFKSTRNLPESIVVGVNESKLGKTHNDLIFKTTTDKDDTPKVLVHSIDPTKAGFGTVLYNVEPNTRSDSNLKANDFLKNLPHFNVLQAPKRVHISGHRYEYDIFYGHDKDGKNQFYNHDNFGKIERDVPPTPTEATTSQEPQIIFLPELANNSELGGIANKNGNTMFTKKKRQARAAETLNDDELPVSGSVVYDLKGLYLSTQSWQTKDREKRLYKLLPMIQDKLKSLTKRTNTTPKEDTNSSVEEPMIPDAITTEELTTTEKTLKDEEGKDVAKSAERIENLVSWETDNESEYDKRKQPAYSETLKMSKKAPEDNDNITPKVDKRDTQNQNTYTAKDVAALEIIIDLMKNPLNIEDEHKDMQYMVSKNVVETTKSVLHGRDSMNSIEVHIAIPYDFQNNNKRSLEFEPMRLRKVFSARMSSPVDLEYQVHSYEGLSGPPTTQPTVNIDGLVSSSSTEGLLPGMYLLVHKSLSSNGYVLKPVTAPIQVVNNRDTLLSGDMTTSRYERVTLSKDFIAAVNKQIVDIFDNVTNVPYKRQTRQADTNEAKKPTEEPKSNSLWEAIKKFFGHDRVCSCKCKPYEAMCRACAASDAVISELIFEFDNLAKYMKDHCTEIQTFFWMNPTGGKKLRDSVHKIDTSMRDYFKRVKGKCQGRTCKTFSTYIDKRNPKHDQSTKDVGATFVNDVAILAEDVDKITKVVTCFNTNLKDRSDRMIHAIGNCINAKLYNKRSDINNTTTKKLIKNVYSLDNINVNIICNADISTTTEYLDIDTYVPLESTLAPHKLISAIELGLEEIKLNNKKRKGFKKFFTKKKLFTYYVTPDPSDKPDPPDTPQMKKKRDLTQVVAPLISDSGGTFWYDYIKGKTNEPRNVRKTKQKLEPQVGVTVVQTRNKIITDKQYAPNKINDILLTVRTSPKTLVERDANTSALVSYHFNRLLKLFENIGVNDVKNVSSTTPKPTPIPTTKKVTFKTKNPITTKCTKIIQKIKDKICKCNNTCTKCKQCKCDKTCKNCIKCKETKYTEKSPTKPKPPNKSGYTIAMQAEVPSTSFDTTFPTAKQTYKSLVKKIIDNLTKGNYLIDEEKLTSVRDDKKRFTSAYSDDYKFKSTKGNTADNVTIMIIDELDDPVNDKKSLDDYKNLLLSIIQHETNKLNEEWFHFAYNNKRRESGKTKKKAKKHKLDKTTDPLRLDNLNVVDVINDLEIVQPSKPTKKNKTKGLLDKIAIRMGIKTTGMKEKAGKKRHFDIVTWSAAATSPVTDVKDELQSPEETGDSAHQICNIQATCNHIRELYDQLPSYNFENYVKNITCYKSGRIKRFFFIEYPNREERRWDWIRKRSLKEFDSHSKLNHINVATGIMFNDDEFEKFVKGDDGIYRIRNRQKRTVAELKDLDDELRNVAPLKPAPNEVYAMLGDNIVIDCTSFTPSIDSQHECTWKSERQDMLRHNNIIVDGPRITFHNIGPRNEGIYSCTQGAIKLPDIRVSVVTPPEYTVVFTPNYLTKSCNNQDLKAIQLLGPEISKDLSCGDHCSVRIDEPVCQKNVGSRNYHVKSTAVMSMKVDPALQCSVQCRRDLQSSLALLVANNVPRLARIGVIVLNEGKKKVFLPSRHNQKSIVTHKLKKKDSNDHHEYHDLAAHLSPGDVDVVLACPAGFYLIQDKKICASCPANTSSSRGDNVCGSRGQAVRACHKPGPLRRYDWWWYPPCGYLVACGGVGCACGVCAALALLGHVTSRATSAQPADRERGGNTGSKKPSLVSAFVRSPRAHPLSPSRVILARFFRPSLTSSRATDSQETKFELWKEKNMPPPLPPIDFDF